MTNIQSNVVTHFPSLSLGTLFKNPNNTNDPNIYVLFSGHVCSVDTINATFLTFQNKTINAKVLNVNIWIDVACAVLENPNEIDFLITSQFSSFPLFLENQSVTFFSNYQINDTTVKPITSNIRVPNYMYPQNMNNFFYPDSILLKESQGVFGVSGSPIINSNNEIIAIVSKIIGNLNYKKYNSPSNLIGTKMSMIYNFLFDNTKGLVSDFFRAYINNPSIVINVNLLILFRNNFNIAICHLGFLFRSYKDITSNAKMNLSQACNGIILKYRITGINKMNYKLTYYLQKNDQEITYFKTLLDNSDLLSDFYQNKSSVLLKTLSYIDRNGSFRKLDLGTESISNYYVNGDPSKSVTIDYLVFGPSGINGTNMIFGPVKNITISPTLVSDGENQARFTSQLPRIMTSTTSRSSEILRCNLYNQTTRWNPYLFVYSALSRSLQASLRTENYKRKLIGKEPLTEEDFLVSNLRKTYSENIKEINDLRLDTIYNKPIDMSNTASAMEDIRNIQKNYDRINFLRNRNENIQSELESYGSTVEDLQSKLSSIIGSKVEQPVEDFSDLGDPEEFFDALDHFE